MVGCPQGFLATRLNDDHSLVSGCPDCPIDKICFYDYKDCECRPGFVENIAGECTWCQGKEEISC